MEEVGECKCWKRLVDPSQFMLMSERALLPLSVTAVFLLTLGLYLAFQSPVDYRQGVTVKIMFVHAPLAWIAVHCYTVMTISAIRVLFWHRSFASIVLKTATPLGAIFTTLALITGSLWGRPVWGTWWEWDARLASMFILFLIYVGIFAFSRAFENAKISATRATAILTIFGFINIPIIKFSVQWWNSLHQPALILYKGGFSVDSAILMPLVLNAFAFALVFVIFYFIAIQNEVLRQRVIATQRLIAQKSLKADML
ncbi:MAG: heme exporter protein C [Candidatus Tokpelaia sp. JSC188]|nr:MAG: heme exporter protein C [Candidatus Tokpelaia sp. JSC188]